MMKETPILFSHDMAQAAFDEVKTETRRIVKGEVPEWATCGLYSPVLGWSWYSDLAAKGPRDGISQEPYQVGQILWVREPYFQRGHWAPLEGQKTKGGRQKYGFVPADENILFLDPAHLVSADPWHRRLARFMPRKYSRLRLQVKRVSIQRLQEIESASIWSEGVPRVADSDGQAEWRALWERINGVESWEANPFVWVVVFEKLKQS
jgi:hypothetical protein